jgi:Methyltransferase domain
MVNIQLIANQIYDICYDVDKNIFGGDEQYSHLWAKHNSFRYAHVIKKILEYSEKYQKKAINILNASGLSCGHQDFSINFYLRTKCLENIALKSWVAYEHPNSKYLQHPLFQKYVENYSIDIKKYDLSSNEQLDKVENYYDVIIFTEIAEHLEHSTFLNTLSQLFVKLHDRGIIIITTPNFACLRNRITLLVGDGDLYYWGDGSQNKDFGLYGHIAYYDINRLTRLLNDSGFNVVQSYTYTPGYGDMTNELRLMLRRLENWMAHLIPNAHRDCFLVVTKGESKVIPFNI